MNHPTLDVHTLEFVAMFLAAREAAEIIMRDMCRMRGEPDFAQMHADRAQAFREASTAAKNLKNLGDAAAFMACVAEAMEGDAP